MQRPKPRPKLRQRENAAPPEVSDSSIKLHFIGEWMDHRGKTVADMVEALDVDKSQVYRWLKGQKPQNDMLLRIAAFLETGHTESILRHPLDDWLARFFKGRTEDEAKAIIEMMEKAWPRTGTSG